ncbi:TlpA disulfide reductase family protein [Maribacter sp. BPC-D8]|uniref:TlpA family protein disulfide reductase n=1 Tax=Maribacter sp. BPC-D8 TaxID=3053613 RepID=UPI002B4A992A|nr:TlpA disulfide reductase family protein [Maribacter sp. BPC-D8]WRI31607.1 TlpA disulfide reductase family protein [Maribacter sp. BPC-D8]
MTRQTVFTLLIIAFVISFFVTPLGDYSKIMLNRAFATSPTIIKSENRGKVTDYDWKLKDQNWKFFNFEEAKGKVTFITFWTSWHMPSQAQLKDVQYLYDTYGDKMKFYVITNEERAPVELFMEEQGYTFPVTYQIIGEPSPISLLKPPGSYLIDKTGSIVIHQNAIADWDNDKVDKLLNQLIAE